MKTFTITSEEIRAFREATRKSMEDIKNSKNEVTAVQGAEEIGRLVNMLILNKLRVKV